MITYVILAFALNDPSAAHTVTYHADWTECANKAYQLEKQSTEYRYQCVLRDITIEKELL
jgi:hypothetical protein